MLNHLHAFPQRTNTHGSLLFLFSVFLQIWVSRHHKKEKKYGPSPANNYTSGSGRKKFWQRKGANQNTYAAQDTQTAPAVGGGKKKFWQRNKGGTQAPYTQDPHAKDTEMNAYGGAGGVGSTNGGGTTLATDQTANPYRPSGETGYTGNTGNSGFTGTTMGPQDHQPQYGSGPDHGGYHTGPTGTSVNPYGYDQRPGAASNF